MELSLEKLLEQVAQKNFDLRIGKISKRTHKNVGFVVDYASTALTRNNATSCYLHTGDSHRGLSEGDKLLMSTTPSQRIEGRLDVAAYTRYPKDLLVEMSTLDGVYLGALLPLFYSQLSPGDWDGLWNVWLSNPGGGGRIKKGSPAKSLSGVASHLQKILEPKVWQAAIKAQPIGLIPAFLPEIVPSIGRLSEYLLDHYKNENTVLKGRVNDFIYCSNEVKAQLTLMNLEGVGYPDDLGLSLLDLEAGELVLGLKLLTGTLKEATWLLLWQDWHARPREYITAIKSGLDAELWQKAKEAIPNNLILFYLDIVEPDATDLWHYISTNHEKLTVSDKTTIKHYIDMRSDIVEGLSALPLEPSVLPIILGYFVPREAVFWSFITNHLGSVEIAIQEQVRDRVKDSGYIQAGFLLYLVDRGIEKSGYPLHLLAKDVDKLVSNLFDHHSVQQSPIRKTIFLDCPVKQGFSACEVSIAPNKQASEPDTFQGGNNKEFNYWCRRYPCSSGECLVNHDIDDDQILRDELPIIRRHLEDKISVGDYFKGNNVFVFGGYFYTLVKKYWGYKKTDLHDQVNSPFLRPLAALNRWNEIIERLHCHGCKSPLRISEHSPNAANKMAYFVTYWHCANKACSEYARSVKLSHCTGSLCHKVIDSREDRQTCTPWEVRSYKKMYLCTKCGSCCPTHADSGYINCASCGRKDAYTRQPDSSGRLECAHCRHQITVPWDKRKQVKERFYNKDSLTHVYETLLPENSTLLLLPRQFLVEGDNGVFSLVFEAEKPNLYVYDLFACLKNGYIKNLSKYHKIYDIRAIEKLHYLGQFHPRYNGGETKKFGLIKHLEEVSDQITLDQLSQRINNYLNNLLRETNINGVLKHYEQLELPFTLSLYSMLGEGFEIDRNALSLMTKELEVARNVSVESLRDKGIDTPTRDRLKMWLPYSDSDIDISMLLNRIDSINFKSIRHIDPVFEAFYCIEKIERMGSCIKSVYELPGLVIPDYQVIGTSTLRCTSQRPNILGFPKQLRPVVKASNGKCIVECDYSQMEIGVLAALSKDKVLIEDYSTDDVYNALAKDLDLDRDQAKLVFLGIIYGVSNKTLQLWTENDESGVRGLLSKFFDRYKVLADYQKALIEKGEALGYVEAVSGVKRSVNKKVYGKIDNYSRRGWEHNWFKNYPVQASAAMVFKRAIVEIAENVEPREFKLIAPLYDAVIFEVKIEKKEYFTDLVCSSMRRAMNAYFPILSVQVAVNDYDTTCWNGGEGVPDLSSLA